MARLLPRPAKCASLALVDELIELEGIDLTCVVPGKACADVLKQPRQLSLMVALNARSARRLALSVAAWWTISKATPIEKIQTERVRQTAVATMVQA